MKRALIAVTCLAAGACRFDATVGKGVTIRCAADSECPEGLVCGGDGKCRTDHSTGDFTAPTFAATVAQAFIREGAVQTGQVVVSEPVVRPPSLVLTSGSVRRAVETDAAASNAQVFPFAFTIGPEDPEGAWEVLASGEDLAGNAVANAPTGAGYTVDKTPPTLLVSGTVVTPAMARPGQTLALTLAFSEAVKPGFPVALVGPGGTSIATLTPTSSSSSVFNFSLTLPAGLVDGMYGFAADGVEDLAGNPAGKLELPKITVDGTPPVIAPLGLAGRRFSGVATFNTFTAKIRLSDSSATAELCVGGRPCVPAVDGQDVAITVDRATDFEGPNFVVVKATDAAGNRATEVSELVIFDFTPPTVIGTPTVDLSAPPGCNLAQVTALGVGATMRVYFTLDEPVLTTPTVAGGALSFTKESGAGNAYVYRFTLAQAAPDSVGAVNVVATDAVGNSASRFLTSLSVRTSVPATLTPAQQDRLLYQRVPWGADETANQPRFVVVGDAGALPAGDSLVFWSQADTLNDVAIGFATAIDGGSVPFTRLPLADRQVLYAQHVDSACNVDSAFATRLKHVELVATLGAKVVGSDVENPNSFETREVISPAQVAPGLVSPTPSLVSSLNGQRDTTTAGATWSQLTDTSLPPAGTDLVMAYDAARQRTVLFVGPSAATWEYDGRLWVAVATVGSPPTRSQTAMAYDSARRVMVLFGGAPSPSGPSPYGDTWEFDGVAWSQRATVHGPPARQGALLAYDDRRHVVVLFGGSALTGPFTDTWEYDGVDWVHRTTATEPPANSAGGMAYDPTLGRLVMFGGTDPVTDGSINDTWEYDGFDWRQATPTLSPGARAGNGIAYDTVAGRIVVFGGIKSSGLPVPPPTYYNELWQYTGTTWVPVTATNPPSKRDGVAMAFDQHRRAMTVFGGYDPGTGDLDETWNLKGTAWSPSVRPNAPSARSEMGATYDSTRGLIFAFGGLATAGTMRDTWIQDGGGWAAFDAGASAPPARWAPGMAYDTNRGRTVLVGGSEAAGVGNDTWEFVGSNWVKSTPAAPPGPRAHEALAYDPLRKLTVAFAGDDGMSGTFNDLWEFDGGTWNTRAAGAPPSSRRSAAMAYEPSRQTTVLFGGSDYYGFYPVADTWELSGGNWVPLNPAHKPPARGQHRVVYDWARQRLMLTGGATYGFGNGALGDAWEFVGGDWVQRTEMVAPPVRSAHVLVNDSAHAQVLLFGGSDYAGSPLGDTWSLRVDRQVGPAHIFGARCDARALPAGALLTQVTPRFLSGGTSAAGPGVTLQAWQSYELTPLASSAAPATAPAFVQADITAAAALGSLCSGGKMRFVVTTPSGAAFSADAGDPIVDTYATVSTDYVEVRIRYDVP